MCQSNSNKSKFSKYFKKVVRIVHVTRFIVGVGFVIFVGQPPNASATGYRESALTYTSVNYTTHSQASGGGPSQLPDSPKSPRAELKRTSSSYSGDENIHRPRQRVVNQPDSPKNPHPVESLLYMVTMQQTVQSFANTLVNPPSNLTPAPVPPPDTNPTVNVLLTDGNNVPATSQPYYDSDDNAQVAARKETYEHYSARLERKREHPNSYTTSSELGLYSRNTGRELYTGPTVPRGKNESLEDFKDRTGQNTEDSPQSTNGRPLTPSRGHYADETPTSGTAKQNPFGS